MLYVCMYLFLCTAYLLTCLLLCQKYLCYVNFFIRDLNLLFCGVLKIVTFYVTKWWSIIEDNINKTILVKFISWKSLTICFRVLLLPPSGGIVIRRVCWFVGSFVRDACCDFPKSKRPICMTFWHRC